MSSSSITVTSYRSQETLTMMAAAFRLLIARRPQWRMCRHPPSHPPQPTDLRPAFLQPLTVRIHSSSQRYHAVLRRRLRSTHVHQSPCGRQQQPRCRTFAVVRLIRLRNTLVKEAALHQLHRLCSHQPRHSSHHARRNTYLSQLLPVLTRPTCNAILVVVWGASVRHSRSPRFNRWVAWG